MVVTDPPKGWYQIQQQIAELAKTHPPDEVASRVSGKVVETLPVVRIQVGNTTYTA